MRTPHQDAALTAFIDAAISDEDYGYPDGAAFIGAEDTEYAARLLWRYLHEGRPTILVKDDQAEMLIHPVRLNFFRRLSDRVQGRIPVQVAYRPYPMKADDHPVQALRAEIRRDALVDDMAFACA
ncbi:MAG: hypothetical protein M3Y34_06175 [Actinomycetota bacterium]|nr:hypothetical protein [Actinomycetota bacterium]